MTDALLIVGVVAASVFVAVLLVEGALRPGYNPTYHTGSALSLGERGWVQVANFLQLGVGMFAFAVGVGQRLNDLLGAGLMAIFGLGAIIAGVFRMDPMRGYPPGTPGGTPAELTRRHQVHDAAGPVMFLVICGACLAVARQLEGPWRLYTVLTGVAGLVLTVSTAVAWQKDAKYTGLVQRVLIVVYCSWIVLLGIRLL
jgi:hypothetical protein